MQVLKISALHAILKQMRILVSGIEGKIIFIKFIDKFCVYHIRDYDVKNLFE